MVSQGIILYGGPASGKDTIFAALETLGPFETVRKIKAGAGRIDGYRAVSSDEFNRLAASGDVLSSVARYGNRYGVIQQELDAITERGAIPVLHTTSAEELILFSSPPFNWRPILIWANRFETIQRLRARGSEDLVDRMKLWSSSQQQLAKLGGLFQSVIRTDVHNPLEAARLVASPQTDDLGELNAVLRSADVIVPVPTIRNSAGGVDWELNYEFAQRAASWPGGVLVGGSTGEGESLSIAERAGLWRLWQEHFGVRCSTAVWSLSDLRELAEDCDHLDDRFVVAGLQNPSAEALSSLAREHEALIAYSHPRFGQLTSESALRSAASFDERTALSIDPR